MKKRKSELQDLVRDLGEQAEGIKRKIANIDFTYSDPTPDFDRRKVKGLVAQLFNLPEENFESATALEVCAGGRLYNVTGLANLTLTVLGCRRERGCVSTIA
jgi:structural maintenance of chromosome 2